MNFDHLPVEISHSFDRHNDYQRNKSIDSKLIQDLVEIRLNL
jgi:hypothetical protein